MKMTNKESCAVARESYSRMCNDTDVIMARFWNKVSITSPEGCWEWNGSLTTNGYGGVTIQKKWKQTHRVSFEWFHGPLNPGDNVLHKCDNRKCCNPHHLFKGTLKDNSIDASIKGRLGNARGERNFNTTLTDDKVLELRDLHSTGKFTHKQLSTMFGVCKATVHNIVTRKTWKHI